MHFGFLALDYPSASSGGGVGSQTRVLARTLVKAGHRATVIALRENNTPAEAQDEGVKVYRVSPGNLHWYVSRLPGLKSLVVMAIRELEYSKAMWSAVHSIQRREPFDLLEGSETGVVYTAFRERKIPLVIRLHGDPFTFSKYTPGLKLTPALRLSRMIQRMAFRRCRLLISPSVGHLREVSGELHGHHPPVEVLPNAIGSLAERAEAAEPLQKVLQSEGPLVLYVGRIEKCKGIPTLLEAAARIRRAVPECRFALAGGPHPTLSAVEVRRKIEELNLDDAVHLLGHVPHESLGWLYARSSVAVVPSHYETFGIAALEAMKLGVPVVATAVGGLPEVVADGDTGVIVAPGDATALADAVVSLLVDKDRHDELSRKARQRASRFDAARQVPRNLELYHWAAEENLHGEPDTQHVFYSAHPDDVALSCGGFVASLVSARREVRVVTVFAGAADQGAAESAYARHLRSKWGAAASRKEEDRRALTLLGVEQVEHANFADAPWRRDSSGQPIYAAYEELNGGIAPEDEATAESLAAYVDARVRDLPASAILYFPLALGDHVDHRHLFRIGVRMRAAGRRVRFYEDWPYADAYAACVTPGWLSRNVPIDTAVKLKAIEQYESQMFGLGGSRKVLRQRLEHFARNRGGRGAMERYWEPSLAAAERMHSGEAPLDAPFHSEPRKPRLRDFGEVVQALSRRDAASSLPPGSGVCVDLGSSASCDKAALERKGYRWLGVRAEGRRLPFRPRSVAAMVMREGLQSAELAGEAISEAARVLEPGGVLCCAGDSGIRPHQMKLLLAQQGFKDIEMLPGMPLRRTAWRALPRAAFGFTASWLALNLGLGSGEGMRCIAEQAPLEFAGQIVFMARKTSRE